MSDPSADEMQPLRRLTRGAVSAHLRPALQIKRIGARCTMLDAIPYR